MLLWFLLAAMADPVGSSVPAELAAPVVQTAPVTAAPIEPVAPVVPVEPAAPAAAEQAAWYACLEDYAQVAMASNGSAVTIALQTDEACAAERKAFQVALFRSRTIPGDAAALNTRLAAEDRAAYEHVIRFVERMR